MIQSEKIDKILPAIFAVKKELESVKKTSKNPFFKSKYADLNAHLDLVEPLLEKHGCFLMQPPLAIGADTTVSETIIFHSESGQYIGGSMTLLVGKPDMQQLGAAATYARRFVLGGLLSMKAEDDDGNVATGKTTVTETVKPKNSLPSTGFKSFGSGGGFGKKKDPEPDKGNEGDMY